MGQPSPAETYDWFTAELANLRTAFRWAADNDDLDVAAAIAIYATILGILGGQYEPVAWAEELIEPARAVDHPRLLELYEMASHSVLVGKFETAVGYGEAGQKFLGNGREVTWRSTTARHAGTLYVYGGPASTGGRRVPRLAGRWSRDRQTRTRSALVVALSFAGLQTRRWLPPKAWSTAAEATRNPSASLALLAEGFAFRDSDRPRPNGVRAAW